MAFADLAKDIWALIVAGAGVIVWLVRLEGTGRKNSSDIARIERQRAEDLRERNREMDQLRQMLSEVQKDIKTLLQRR